MILTPDNRYFSYILISLYPHRLLSQETMTMRSTTPLPQMTALTSAATGDHHQSHAGVASVKKLHPCTSSSDKNNKYCLIQSAGRKSLLKWQIFTARINTRSMYVTN